MLEINLLPSAIPELFAQVSYQRRLSIADRYGLMAALLDESLDQENRAAIDRLLRSVRKGYIAMVDEISTLRENF